MSGRVAARSERPPALCGDGLCDRVFQDAFAAVACAPPIAESTDPQAAA